MADDKRREAADDDGFVSSGYEESGDSEESSDANESSDSEESSEQDESSESVEASGTDDAGDAGESPILDEIAGSEAIESDEIISSDPVTESEEASPDGAQHHASDAENGETLKSGEFSDEENHEEQREPEDIYGVEAVGRDETQPDGKDDEYAVYDPDAEPAGAGSWSDRFSEGKGALPRGLLAKAGVGIGVVAVVAILLTVEDTGSVEEPTGPTGADRIASLRESIEETGGEINGNLSVQDQAAERIRRQQRAAGITDDSSDEEETEALAEANVADEPAETGDDADVRHYMQELERLQNLADQQAGQLAQASEPGTPAVAPAFAAPLSSESQAIQELRERLALERMEREARANRAEALAWFPGMKIEGVAMPDPPESPARPQTPGERLLEDALAMREEVLAERDRLLAGGAPGAGIGQQGGVPPPTAPNVPDAAPPVSPYDPSFDAPNEQADLALTGAPGTDLERTLLEGTLLPATLASEIDSDTPGPVIAFVSKPVYARDRVTKLIPMGTKVYGEFEPVAGGRRLSIRFARMVFHDGRSVQFGGLGLDTQGRGALADSVNMHTMQRIGAVGLVGTLTALPQALVARSASGSGSNTGSGLIASQGTQVVGEATSEVALEAVQPILARRPTVKVRAGRALRIYLAADTAIP